MTFRDPAGSRSGLAVVLAAVVAVAPARVRAAPDAETFVVQAETALGEQKYAEAADLFERAYRSLSARERTSELGEHLVLNAAEAHEQAWLASDDTVHLQQASKLLRKHIAVAEVRKVPVSEEIEQTQSRIDGLVKKLDWGEKVLPPTTPFEPTSPSSEPDPATGPVPEGEPDPNASDRRRPDGLTIGLLAGGATGIVGGAAMLGVGAALPGWAQNQLDSRGGMGEQDQQFLDDADQLSLGLMVGGGVLAGLGLAALVWGSVRAVRGTRTGRSARTRGTTHADRHVRSDTRVQVVPTFGPRGQGLSISGRW